MDSKTEAVNGPLCLLDFMICFRKLALVRSWSLLTMSLIGTLLSADSMHCREEMDPVLHTSNTRLSGALRPKSSRWMFAVGFRLRKPCIDHKYDKYVSGELQSTKLRPLRSSC